MKKLIKVLVVMLITLCLTGENIGFAESVPKKINNMGIQPTLNEGKKWRIGYCGMNKAVNHNNNLHAITEGLQKTDWLVSENERPDVCPQKVASVWDNTSLWMYLSKPYTSDYIEFVEDAYYFPTDKQREDLDAYTEYVVKDVQEKDIDLMIVMGTIAGEHLTKVALPVKKMVFSTNDAIASGIVKEAKDSGKDYTWAHMYPDRFKNYIQVFYDTFKFETLGIVYEDTPTGRVLGGVEDVYAVAEKNGFKVVSKTVEDKDNETHIEDYHNRKFYKELKKAYEALAEEVDAVYFSLYNARTVEMVEELMEPFYEKCIPVFTLHPVDLNYGVLMSVTDMEEEGLSSFYADAITRGLVESSLRNIEQIYNVPPGILLNQEVAKRMGYAIPFELLLAADKIYNEIEKP